MTRFTAEEAIDAKFTPDATILDWATTRHIIEEHHCDPREFHDDHCSQDTQLGLLKVDAGTLFEWLGY